MVRIMGVGTQFFLKGQTVNDLGFVEPRDKIEVIT